MANGFVFSFARETRKVYGAAILRSNIRNYIGFPRCPFPARPPTRALFNFGLGVLTKILCQWLAFV